MNPYVANKLLQAVTNRYFRRIRCIKSQRTKRDLRRVKYWDRVFDRWAAKV